VNPSWASRLTADLDASKGRAAIAKVLLPGLLEGCAADAVVVWLPTDPDAAPKDGEVFVGGTLPFPAGHAGMIEALRADAIQDCLAELGGAQSVVASRPPHVGRIALAWRSVRSSRLEEASVALELVIGHLAALLELERVAAQARFASAALSEVESQIARTRRVRAVGELASGVVHDFNNCLTTILGLTELGVTPAGENDPHYSRLMTIRMATLDAAMLVRRLQAVGRPGPESTDREIVDLRDLARMMPGLVSPRWKRQEEVDGVKFEIALDTMPAPLVYAAAAELRELLLNLLFNAIDAMPSGGRITISTGEADGQAEITIRDEGTGMSPEVLSHLFEPFFTTKGDRGCGLGLNVCRSIAQRHGGSLTADSTPGAGSTFTLRLPAAPADLLALAQTKSPSIGRADAFGLPGGASALRERPRRILLVDDQPDVRESVGGMLRALGNTVVTAGDAASAVAQACRLPMDVVVTDMGMPGMNGAELARRLHSIAPRLPVVMLTGWELDQDAPLPQNVVLVLSKPVTMKALGGALAACSSYAPSMEDQRVKCS
jgi:signal transduction histidine kinase